MKINYSNEKFEACYKDVCVRSEGEGAKALMWLFILGVIGVASVGVAKALKG